MRLLLLFASAAACLRVATFAGPCFDVVGWLLYCAPFSSSLHLLASPLLPLLIPAPLLVGCCIAHHCSSLLPPPLASPLLPLLFPAQLLVGCCIARCCFSSLLLDTTTFPFSIAATIECNCHPSLPLLLLPSIATVECQNPPSSIATIISLVAGHFCRQPSTTAFRQYHCQPPPAIAVPVDDWLLFVLIAAPHLIHLPVLCDCRRPCSRPLLLINH